MSRRHQITHRIAGGAERCHLVDRAGRLLHPQEARDRQEQERDRREPEDRLVFATGAQDEEAEPETEQRPDVAQTTGDAPTRPRFAGVLTAGRSAS